MILKVIASSSRGNCFLLLGANETLIIEAGVRLSSIKKALGFDLSPVAGCVISHEHKDHSKCIKELTQSGVDVYSSPGTLEACNVNGHRTHPVNAKEKFNVGEFTVLPFDIKHDCKQPYGYLIKHPEIGTLLFATDTYYIPYTFEGLTNIMIECNYDDTLLEQSYQSGRIPKFVRNRILSSHMNLNTCLSFLMANDLSKVNNIVLMHLSDGNANPPMFLEKVREQTGKAVHIAEKGLEINFNATPF